MAEQNKTNKVLLLVVVGVLVALNALFISNYLTTKDEKKQVEMKLESTENAKNELEKQYSDVMAQLDELKGKDTKLNSLVEEQKSELDAKVAQIRQMLQEKKLDKGQLDKAMDEIRRLTYMRSRLNERIDSLNAANGVLKDQAQNLMKDVKDANEKNENLTVENTGLKNVKAVASILKTENLTALTYNISSKGKEKETGKAASANRLKITFNLGDNYVAEKNQKVIYMKLINPSGGTIPSPDQGSFTFQGTETTYTQKINFQYTNTKQQLQLVWDKGNTTLNKGDYKVELYCEGFIIGSGSFKLR
jgi:DNA repair exonuclease SbcCD ATPase subunit